MTTIHVPNVPGPTVQLCYASPPLDGSQGNPMEHCDRRKGHGGKHTWELWNALIALRKTWQTRAKADARYGAAQATTSDREYYGTVNAAFAVIECSDELTQAAGLPQ